MNQQLQASFAALALSTLATASFAQSAPARQDHNVLRQTVTQFLTVQAGGLPGQISVTVGAIDPRLNLSACAAHPAAAARRAPPCGPQYSRPPATLR